MSSRKWDAGVLDDLSRVMRDASICGLGQAAPNPLLSVLKYFPDEIRLAAKPNAIASPGRQEPELPVPGAAKGATVMPEVDGNG
jgi:formate dehydrogenase